MKPSKIRFSLLLALILIYCAWTVAPVSAHALLVRSIPQANASLPNSPVQVELFFSEAVEGRLSAIKVLDTTVQAVDLGDTRVDSDNPTHLTVSLRSLSDGVYTVSWKAISAADGHMTTGSFPFAVGNVEALVPAQANPQTNSASLSASALAAKWLLLIALALLVGKLPFKTLIWRPSLRQSQVGFPLPPDEPAGWSFLVRLALTGLLLSLGLGMLAQAGQTAGGELALPWAPEMGRMLIETRLGLVWLARVLLTCTSVWLALSQHAAWKAWGLFVSGLALLLTESLTSHAFSEPHPFLPVLADWTHLVVMGVWVGGLVYFVTGLHEIRQVEGKPRTALTSRLIMHFSTLALTCVGLLGISGVYSAILRLGTLPALFDTLYGRALLLKLGLAALLVGLGAVNLLIISPRLRRDRLNGASNLQWVTRFGKVVLGEVILACVVLFSASLLSSLPPAQFSATTTDLTGSARVDDLQIDLIITPGRVGANTFTLRLASGGQPVQSVKEALLRFTPSRTGLPPSEAQLTSKGDGIFSARGAYLSLPDSWQVQVVVRRENKFDAFANFNFTVRNPAVSDRSYPAAQAAGGLVSVIGLAFGLVIVSLVRKSALRTVSGGLLAGVLLGLGIILLTHPQPTNPGAVNPIPPNLQSVADGKIVYTRDCIACHGIMGKGDGPVGLTLNPRPADLSLHALPGVHTDAQLFQWITDSFPNSRMPSFKSSLSDTDRWNLVNFIRTLAPK